MKILTTPEEFGRLKTKDRLDLQCYRCSSTFHPLKANVLATIRRQDGRNKYCSAACANESQKEASEIICETCSTPFLKLPSEIRNTKHHFCSQKCAAIFNNRHRATGGRRSKAESLIVKSIAADFPGLNILLNDRSALPSKNEIDILIPICRLAIEVNGPTHYVPIFGEDALRKTQANDALKQAEIRDIGYSLLIVNISAFSYWPKCKEFLLGYYQAEIKPVMLA